MTWLTRSACWNWRVERLTETVSPEKPFSCHLLRLGAGRAQDPFADRDDEPGELRDGDEFARRDEAQLRVAPAQERLGPEDLGRLEVEEGLEVELELVVGDGLAEAALEGEALDGLGVHGGRVELVVVAPLLLGPVHRRVGVADERFRVVTVRRIDGDADARRDEELAAVDPEGIVDRFADLPGDLGRVFFGGDARDEERELVAAEARDRVALADVLLDALGDLAEQLVADGVAQRVVDDLEAVEVEEEHGEPLVVAVRLGHGERQAVAEEEPVRQVGQRIVEGEVLDLLLGPLALGDVDRRALDDRQPAVRPLDEVLALEDPDEAPVLALQAELVVGQGLALEELRERGLPVFRLDVEVPGGLLEDFLAGGVSEDAREGLVAVEDPALERRAVHPGEVALEESAVPLLRETQGLFDLAAAADVRDRADAERRLPARARQERRGVVPVRGSSRPS